MIAIDSITIENLRGIKRLSLQINDANLVIHGPNGSGKSGVIDAIEFALTGNICRLSGMGTSSITLNTHGPHVDFRDNTRKAKVILKLKSILTSNTFTVERSVSAAKRQEISPDNDEGRNILSFLEHHPEFSLSRREILKFIVAEPKKRATEVQNLLKMDSIDKTRDSLNKLNNGTKRTLKEKSDVFSCTENELLRHFEIEEISKNDILEKANTMRQVLGLDRLTSFELDIKLSGGIAESSQEKKRLIDKKALCSRIKNLLKRFDDQQIKPAQLGEAAEAINILTKNTDALLNLKKQNFYENGATFISNNTCPFCDTKYNLESLIDYVREKIEANKIATEFQKTIETGCSSLCSEYRIILSEITEIKRDALVLELIKESEELIALVEKTNLDNSVLNNPISHLENAVTLLQNPYNRFDNSIKFALNSILETANKIPDYSSEEKAKQFLILADERLGKYKTAKKSKITWDNRTKLTNGLLTEFEVISESKLTELYEEVESDFTKFYSKINNDDEKDFSSQLTHTKGSLNLEVDFYGRGAFPPNAFHSEGHQDGMGLCLYLALSKKIMADKFTFCLLDDVLMSVDTNHRREFCRLLKSEFPNTQFIITTHDEIWKRQLITEGLVKSNQVRQFRTWSVESGPSCFNEEDILKALNIHIENENISEAAPILRQHLEYILKEISIKLRAKLESRHSSSYELGELIDAVISKYSDILKKSKKAANSWNQPTIIEKINDIEERFTLATSNTARERWALNPMVHHNDWANFSLNEFQDLRDSFLSLTNQFKCQECSTWIYALPIKGNIDEIRCECGNFSMNLRHKDKN